MCELNSSSFIWKGGVYQQATSVVSTTNQRCYEQTKAGTPGCFSIYGTEYQPGNDGCGCPHSTLR